ncbi:MAG: PEGA domain-containing protein [Prevotellaceae bacterium]|nr:PEGA domain-containing protein [Candidatus Faecinaster equi]
MKRLSVLICLVLFGLCGSAQKLDVESFSEMTNDLSASTTPRVDNNGTPCALVKVQLASAIAQFEGLVMGAPVYKTSEYWVYMAAGSKKLTIKLEGYLPLSVYFDNYGITSLESKMTYSMVITGIVASVQPQQEVRTRTGWIILDSYPQGASAYINGDFVGTTPLNNYKQPYGSYSYRLDKPNYHSVTGTIELNSNRFEKTETLLPAFGAISVTSSVNGASVLLDGKATDMYTPCTLDEIPSGQHTITVQLDKYAPKQTSVTVEDSKTTVVNAALDARFASIIVRSLNGASIYIDDVFQGTSSSTIELMEGYYDIEVRLDHHKTVSKQIQVVASQPQTLELFPVPIYGSLDIMSTPHNASITIDGKPYGKTPFTVDQLLEGDHTVTLSLEGHSTETRVVTISKNKTESLTATLQSGTTADAYFGKRRYLNDVVFIDEYRPLEWIYGGGGKGYLNSQVYPNKNITIKVKYKIETFTSGIFIGSSSVYRFFPYNSDNIYWDYERGSGYARLNGASNSLNKVYIAEFGYGFFRLYDENEVLLVEKTGTISTAEWVKANQSPINIFPNLRNGDTRGRGYIGYCQIYENNVLIRDFQACLRTSDNAAGFLDVVNHAFYTSSNDVPFEGIFSSDSNIDIINELRNRKY